MSATDLPNWDDVVVESVPAHKLAWMRRPELERLGGGQIWEAPAGSLYECPPGHKGEPMIVRLRSKSQK